MHNFDFFPFVVDKHNNVWKYVKAKDHFIKVTPWETGEDRRVNRFQIEKLIESGKLVQMKAKQKIYEIINTRWKNDSRVWEFNGDIFSTNPYVKCDECLNAPLHRFEHKYKDTNGVEHIYFDERYRIGYHNGHIVWFACYHYYPQAILFEFKDANTPPGEQIMWTKVSHIKPIFSINNNSYI